MRKHEVQGIDFEGSTMTLRVDGQSYRVDLLSVSERLANASVVARQTYSVSPSGYGIHWPEIDEDISIDGLIAAARVDLQHAGRKN